MADASDVFETLGATVRPSHTALLVIDVQNDFCGADCRAMLPRLKGVIEAGRAAGVYVVYIRNANHPKGLTNSPSEIARRRILGIRSDVTIDGTPGQDFVAEIAPLPDDPVVRKHRMNSFIGTDLDLLLRCRGIKSLALTGVATHGCVMNTAYAAIGHDYYTVVVEDCVAAAARSLHDVALSALRKGIHYVVPAERLLASWQGAASGAQRAAE